MKYNYKPSLKELGTSLKYRSREYFLENTLHGVPYFVDPARPKWERITWFFLTMASVVMVAIVIVIILDRFETEPTITGLDIVTEHVNVEFPQIFVCFDWTHLNHSYIREDEMMYEQLYSWTYGKKINLESFNPTYKNKNNFRGIFKTMEPNCDSLITECIYRGVNMLCNNLFTKVLTAVGACCQTKNLQPLKLFDSGNLEFKTPNSAFPLRFYFVQQNSSGPKPGERSIVKAYFPVDVEFIVHITYTTSDLRFLRVRQRKCLYKHESADFNDCEIACFANKLFSHCNCLPWFLSANDKTECPLSKYSCLNDATVDMTKCDCWLSCDHTSYSIRMVKKSLRDRNRITLRNWPTALYKREMRFGYLDLIVSFGGIAGLFLGYSLLTSIELGYYFSLKTYCGAVIESSRKQYNIVTVHVAEKLPRKVDVNTIYYQYTD